MALETDLLDKLPNINTGSIVGVVTYILVGLVILILLGVVAYVIILRLKFNRKIVIFEKINGKFEPARKDRAMFVRFGIGGDQIFFIKKLKKYVPIPELQTGRNTYWFFLRQDGELINFAPGDFDEQSKRMGAHFLDKEMRYARVSLQGHWKERYDKPKFWEKYGSLIINVIAILIIMVFLFLILDKFLSSLGTIESLMETQQTVLETNNRVLGALDNICSGSGIKI